MTRKDKKKTHGTFSRRGTAKEKKATTNDDPFSDNESLLEIDPLFLSAIEKVSPQQYRAFKKSEKSKDHVVYPQEKRQDPKVTEVDLHGCSVREALGKIDRVIAVLIKLPEKRKPPQGTVLKIITGKGRHSGNDGGILIKEVYSHVAKTYRLMVVRIDSPPAEDTLNGLPLRGFFMVTIR